MQRSACHRSDFLFCRCILAGQRELAAHKMQFRCRYADVPCRVVSCEQALTALMMEAVRTSETWVYYGTTRRYYPRMLSSSGP
jgi:hypothetical protein